MYKQFILPLLGLMVVSSCRTPVHVERDNSVNLDNYKTYMWVDTRLEENDESARASQYADISVRNYVNSELQELGWKEVAENPDALVSYDILVERDVVRQSDAVYSEPFSRFYYNPYTKRWGRIYYPSQFIGYDNYEVPVREGTITISLIDAKNDRRIWQGWSTEDLNNNRFTSTEIGKVVRNIFLKFSDEVAIR
jgi:hypothetical protein